MIGYLGHIIDKNGVRPDPKKLIAVKEFPVPKTQKNVKQLLGLAGYYRRFVEEFSKIVNPLNQLLKKDTPFMWTDKPIINEERSRNLHEDDDDTFMTSQEKMNLENTFIKNNEENNNKKGNNSKREYFNSIFTQDDINDFTESSQDPILNINPKFLETFNVSPNEELFNKIWNNFLKYTIFLKLLASKLLFMTIILLSLILGKNYGNLP